MPTPSPFWPPLSRKLPHLSFAHTRSIAVYSGAREELLRGVSQENRDDVARVLELAEKAVANWDVLHTAFYSPPVISDAMEALKRLADVISIPWGGYSQAERCRISIGREEVLREGAVLDPEAHLDSVAALKVSGNFLFDAATHRDFLGEKTLETLAF